MGIMSTSLLAGLFSVFFPPSLKHFTLLTQALIILTHQAVASGKSTGPRWGGRGGVRRVGGLAISNPRGRALC